VCDVYDALVSPRVYRNAWTHREAIGHLCGTSRVQFDQRCVSALERVLEREHGAALPIAV
jgi:HD-GYP domain-containing protein (c-di-GMP phosphodiesterase class II)